MIDMTAGAGALKIGSARKEPRGQHMLRRVTKLVASECALELDSE